MDRADRCCLLGSGQVITLRAGKFWDVVPGSSKSQKKKKKAKKKKRKQAKASKKKNRR